jgi:hypothetical protein
MEEHVLAAVVRLDKAKPTRMIEEFHGAVLTSHIEGILSRFEVSNEGP